MSTRVKNIQQSVGECLRHQEQAPKQSVLVPRDAAAGRGALRHLQRLGSRDIAIRYHAARALLSLGAVCGPLLHEFLAADVWDRRHLEAIEVLKRLQDPDSIPVLRQALRRDVARDRLAAIRGLRWLLCNPSVFLDSLEDACWEVRREAVFALAELRQPKLRFLMAGMTRDPHPLVRGAAVNALGMLGTMSDPELEAAVLRALEDRSEWVRSMGAWAAGHLGLESCREALADVLIRGGEIARPRAVKAASRLGTRCVAQELLNRLPAENPVILADIIRALGSLGHPVARPVLLDMVAGPNPALSRLATEALARIDTN